MGKYGQPWHKIGEKRWQH